MDGKVARRLRLAAMALALLGAGDPACARRGEASDPSALAAAAEASAPRAMAAADAPPPLPGRPARVEVVGRHGKGELRLVEGVPFLRLAGTHREMGADYGALMGDRIRELLDTVPAAELARRASWLDRWRLSRRYTRETLELVRGIAEGAGLPYDQVFWLGFALPGGCSAVLALTPEGLLHGHNQDRPQPARFKVLIEFAPEGAQRYLVSSFAGTVEAYAGMNERGVTVTSNAAPPRPFRSSSSARAMVATAKLRQILETATSLRDAEERVRGWEYDQLILTVGSAEGAGAMFDLAGGQVFRNALPPDRPLVATNSHLAPALGDHPEECPRRAALQARLAERPPTSALELAAALGDAGVLVGTNNALTVNSLVMAPRRRAIYFTVGDGFAGWSRWIAYDWARDRATVVAEPAVDLDAPPVTLKRLPAYPVAWLRRELASAADQDPLWDELGRGVAASGMSGADLPCTVYHRSDAAGADVELQRHLAAHTIPPSPEVAVKTLPEALVASTLQRGPPAERPAAYARLRRWMDEAGYAPAGPPTECYLRSVALEPDPARWITEIRMPVAARGAAPP